MVFLATDWKKSSVKNRSVWFLTRLFFRKTVVGSEKPKANRKVMAPSSPLPGLGEEEGVQRIGFQMTRTEYSSSCKCFTFWWRGNFSTSVVLMFWKLQLFQRHFFHMCILGQSKIFLLRILGLLFVSFLYRDSWSSSSVL